MAEPMVKGAVLREFFVWYQDTRGMDAVNALVERVPEDMRALLDPADPITQLLASSWYPSRLVHAMLDAVEREVPPGEMPGLLRAANRAVVARSATGVYRFLLAKVVTPEIYAALVPRLWRQLHTTGTRKMTLLGATEAESTISAWPGHHPLLCTCVIETMRAVFEHMGKRDVRYRRTSCVSRGARECVTRLTWK